MYHSLGWIELLELLGLYNLPLKRKKAAQPNGCTALIHQLFSSEWQ